MDSLSSRFELLQVLRQNGILYSTPGAPITHRTGEIVDWAFYSWNVTLTERGLRLAAREILGALQTFPCTQIASYGYTGLPLLSACLLEGAGRYTGISIRENRKTHLTNRKLDGPHNRTRPVVIVDDSLSSGTSLFKAITALEEEGFEVLGTVALVHFPYRGAKNWANTAGYRTVTLFDIWSDLEMGAHDKAGQAFQPVRPPLSPERLTEGLPPAVLARRTAEFYLRTRQMPSPPAKLDDDYDGRGGVFVSFRRRSDEDRLARDGFWHFDPCDADPAQDVVYATVDTLTRSSRPISLDTLPDLKIGVTFFGPLEEIQPAGLDFDRYGIVVRSRVWPNKVGGALPNTQVFISEIEQYRHARKTNAKIDDTEPHALYRHTVAKTVDPGDGWLQYGREEGPATGWWRSGVIGRSLVDRARSALRRLCGQSTTEADVLPNGLIPALIEGVAVTLYANGLNGYGFSYAPGLDCAIAEAAEAAWMDKRYCATRTTDPDNMAITVSVLHNGEPLGNAPKSFVEHKLRRGLDALSLTQGGRSTTLLPSALVYNLWSRAQFVDTLEGLAGGLQPQHFWRTHQVAAWKSERGRVLPLRFGFPVHAPGPFDETRCIANIDLLADFIERAIGPDGLPAYYLTPSNGQYVRQGTAGRVVHSLYALYIAGELRGRTDWKRAAARGVERCLVTLADGSIHLPHHAGGALADAVLLAAASVCGFSATPSCSSLASRVASLFHSSGWIGDGVKRWENRQDQDFLPGAAVWALAVFCKTNYCRLPDHMDAAGQFYGHRLREFPTWGSPWVAQGWSALYDLTGEPKHAELAFEAADWAADRQLEKNGAFLETLSPDEPSFNTGFAAEGIVGAWRIASARGDRKRAARYRKSWSKAMEFVDTLTLHAEDVFCFRDPRRAVGGVRCTISRADVRIDQVSHCLHALVEGLPLLATSLERDVLQTQTSRF